MPEVRTFGRLFDDLLYQLDQGEDIAPRLRECAAAYRAVIIPPLDDDEMAELTPERHVIEFRQRGWTIMHPLSCRPRLFDCPVNLSAPPGRLGRYLIELHDGELIVGEPVEAGGQHAK